MASPRNTSRGLLFALTLLVGVATLITPAWAGRKKCNDGPTVLPPNSNAFGKSYGEWGATWWRWAMSIPASSNPIFDPTGASAGVGQSGQVWFLAGTSGSAVTRDVTIPVGKAIFFPVINVLADYPCPPEFNFEPAPGQSLGAFLTEYAASLMNLVDQLSVEIDGEEVANPFDYRAASGPMRFTGDVSLQSAFDPCVTGTEQDGASDGYWILLPPLPRGNHTIHFIGGISSFGFTVEVTYNLHVVPPSHMLESPVVETTSAPVVRTTLKQAAAAAGMGPGALPGTSWGQLKVRYR